MRQYIKPLTQCHEILCHTAIAITSAPVETEEINNPDEILSNRTTYRGVWNDDPDEEDDYE